jgi:phosphate transport system substrate-binding protein
MTPVPTILVAALSLVLLPLAPAFGAAAVDELSYGGSNTIAMSILFDGALKALGEKTGVSFDRFDLKGGTSEGLRSLREGKVTVVGASRRLSSEEVKEGLVEFVIGGDCNALWVNRENPVAGLTGGQAAALLAGRISNWKEVGGGDVPVVLVLAPEGSYSNCQESVREILLKDSPLKKADILADLPQDRLAEVAGSRGGLSLLSDTGVSALLEPGIQAQVKPLAIDGAAPSKENLRAGKYPLERPLVLVTRGEPKGKVKLFIDFMLSPEGQRFVAKAVVPAK